MLCCLAMPITIVGTGTTLILLLVVPGLFGKTTMEISPASMSLNKVLISILSVETWGYFTILSGKL